MTLHYSLYRCQGTNGETHIVDFSSVVRVQLSKKSAYFYIYQSNADHSIYIPIDWLDHFLAAWNRYKYAIAAAQLIKTPEITNPTIACNSAMRIDEYLGFLAGEKLNELAELADQKAA
jgi:hypothetical protein